MSLNESINYLNKLYSTPQSFVSISNEYLQKHDSYESFMNNHRNHLDTIYQELIVCNEDNLIRRVYHFIDGIVGDADIYRFAINSEVIFWQQKEYEKLSIDHFILDNPDVVLYEKLLQKGEKIFDEIRDEQIHYNQKALVLLLFIEQEFPDFLEKFTYTFEDVLGKKTKPMFNPKTKTWNKPDKDIKSPALIWNKSDTDLIELTSALYMIKAIDKPSGSITRKDLLHTLCNIFGMEIKDAESKLSKATLRNNPTKFLNNLKETFESYIDSKAI